MVATILISGAMAFSIASVAGATSNGESISTQNSQVTPRNVYPDLSDPANRQLVLYYSGIPESDWDDAYATVDMVSGWNVYHFSFEPSFGIGLCGSDDPASGIWGQDFANNPFTQMRQCHAKVNGKFGGWANARVKAERDGYLF